MGFSDQVSTSLAPLLEAEVGLSQLTSILRSVTKRKGQAADTVKEALAQLRSIESQARCLGLTLDTVHCIRPGQSSSYVSGNKYLISLFHVLMLKCIYLELRTEL